MPSKITRRSALGSIIGCACCLGGAGIARAAEAGAGHHSAPHWDYRGAASPERWGELSPDFKTCQIGLQQTPIDLTGAVKASFDKPFTLDYRAVAGKVINNGHTIQANLDKGCRCTIEGKTYDLLQFHFHHPSEHLLSGKASEMELHLVHKAEDGALAVIGVFLHHGATNKPLVPVFDHMPHAAGGEHPLPDGGLDPSALVPAHGGYFRYMGSLTTPPCSEGLTWTVMRQPVEVSREQVRAFASLFPHTARPVQKLNDRKLFEGGS